ncbi:MAG: hypothetical protein IT384_14115 [Deltaproteobacteria bacterium]|nr:hypothetical protein [Deltaproteobacteria bacterium]
MESMRKLSARATPSASQARTRVARSESRVRGTRRSPVRARSAILPPPPAGRPDVRVAWERGPNKYFAELVEVERPVEQPVEPAPAPQPLRRPVVRVATQARIPTSISAAPPARTRASMTPGDRTEIFLPQEQGRALVRWASVVVAVGLVVALFI